MEQINRNYAWFKAKLNRPSWCYNPIVPVLQSLEGLAAPLKEGEKSARLRGNMKSQEGVAAPPAKNRRASVHENAEQKPVVSKTAKKMTLPTRTEF